GLPTNGTSAREGGRRRRDGRAHRRRRAARSPASKLLREQLVLAPGGGGPRIEVPASGVVDYPGREVVHLDGADRLGPEVVERHDVLRRDREGGQRATSAESGHVDGGVPGQLIAYSGAPTALADDALDAEVEKAWRVRIH